MCVCQCQQFAAKEDRMILDNKIWLGTSSEGPVFMLPKMANRHGLFPAPPATGKTVSLQVLAEAFSSLGVTCFFS